MIEALLEALALKELPRAGWVRAGVDAPESVAAHSWGVAWLVLALLPGDLDRGRALAYATLHDLPEVRVGDITPADGVAPQVKHAREAEALVGLLAPLGRASTLQTLWASYEAQADPEARFVRQLDRLDMALQAARYTAAGCDPTEFWDSADRAIHHPALRALLTALRASHAEETP